jgi:uncharacterized membrane protein
MAGVGFQLRRLLEQDNYLATLQAFIFSGIISSGPWVLSIAGIMTIGLVTAGSTVGSTFAAPFQISVTYLMMISLLLTSPVQLIFTRYVADRLYEGSEQRVLPNLFGAITIMTLFSGFGGIASIHWFYGVSEITLYWTVMLCCFVALCDIWLLVIVVSCMKSWERIIQAFAVGYGCSIVMALALRSQGVEGLLGGFLIGQCLLFFMLLAEIVPLFPSPDLLRFDFLQAYRQYPSLAAIGIFYVGGSWVDKAVFWWLPDTGVSVYGPFRASPIYDMPLFMAYLSIIPGMSVFLIRLEADFADCCDGFFKAIRQGATLEQIIAAKDRMVVAVRRGFVDMCKIQGLTIIVLISMNEELLGLFGISPVYRMLLNVDLVACGIQLLFAATLNVLFYLDERPSAMGLCLLFVTSNGLLSYVSYELGPLAYGYGFAGATLLSALVGLGVLARRLQDLEYKTFVLQRVRY